MHNGERSVSGTNEVERAQYAGYAIVTRGRPVVSVKTAETPVPTDRGSTAQPDRRGRLPVVTAEL